MISKRIPPIVESGPNRPVIAGAKEKKKVFFHEYVFVFS